MTTRPRPNRDALSEAIDIYRDAMRPFILRRLRQVRGTTIDKAITFALGDRRADEVNQKVRQGARIEAIIDVNDFPHLVQRHWRAAFAEACSGDRSIQSELWLITGARNQVSHPGVQDLEAQYTVAHLYHIANVLGAINAPEQKKTVEDIRARLVAPAPLASEAHSGQASQPEVEQPRSGSNLKPWREVIRPNQDVAQGSYQQAEFAADLQQVHDGRANATQYGNPIDFYAHTYITPGIRALLVNALKRLAGKGGDPVIQTKTGFGGGKTHSLIALYHLVRNAGALLNAQTDSGSRVGKEIRAIMEEAGYDDHTDGLGEVAVLDGAYLSVTDTMVTPETGDPMNTLWGVMAYQLGGQAAYNIIEEAARHGAAPGGRQLDALLEHIGPCVILIDEIVAYVRNAGPAQDSIYTFIQALTQSVRRSPHAALVITLPQSRVEAGAEGGADALDRLDNLMGRIEAVWEPLAVNEAFEVVRRRLFGDITDTAARDQTCEAFARMYSHDRAEYPQGVTERNYLERMKACYPIHPEIFDRLYSDWSSIPDFQRTRGVLRMMATCVSRLYLNNDLSPLIVPANLPLSDERLAHEFSRLLPGVWGPVLSEVDSDNSRTDNIDRASQRFSEVGGAARRVARTVFLGSAPSGAIIGIDARQIHLGVVQPGHGYARYNEALARMTGDLYYLYQADGRYYFHAEENLNKVASDRANALSQQVIDDHIVSKLEEARNRRSDVILYADNTADVPDSDAVRLVTLPPNLSLPSRSADDDTATPEALKILEQRGDSPRFRRNTLLFLTAKRDEIRNLREAARKYLAWNSIINGEARIPNLTGNRLGQARTEVNNADKNVTAALVRAYRWTLWPRQQNPAQAAYEFSQAQSDAPSTGEIFRSAFDKFVEDEHLVDNISPASLADVLQQYVWNRPGTAERVSVDELWTLLTSNVYLPRLRNRGVLETCIQRGVEQGAFGHADHHDGDTYQGLRYGESMTAPDSGVAEGSPGFLIRPEAAARQKEMEQAASPTSTHGGAGVPGGGTSGSGGPDGPAPGDRPDDSPLPFPAQRGPQRVVARKTAGSDLSLDDINALREEIIRNLRSDGGDITVAITVSASKPDGFSESIIRSIRENSAHLGLEVEIE